MSQIHLKDCQAWRDVGLPMTTTNNESAKLFDDVIHQYVTWTESADGIEGTVVKILENDPDFLMGQALSIGLDLMGTGRPIHLDKELSSQVHKFERDVNKALITPREKLHCQSVLHFAHGEYEKACDTWEEILKTHPKDALALKFAHDTYFYLGNSVMVRESIAQVFPHWKPTDSLYGYVKGMYAFGLEETNFFAEAERHSDEALSMNPTDCWATHAKAHCLEMTGRYNEGIDFMRNTENKWNQGRMLACHNYWHWALYHIEKGEFENALALYDQQVENRSVNSGAMLDMVDASSLLTRFELQGVDVGKRWEKIFELCLPHINDHVTVFNDFHMLMAFLACKQTKENVVEMYMSSLKDYCATHSNFSRDLFEELGKDLCEGLVAFSEKKYDKAVDIWSPVKDVAVRMGGSNAQRDVFGQLYLDACINSTVASGHRSVAEASLNERKKFRRDNSPLTDRLMKKLLSNH